LCPHAEDIDLVFVGFVHLGKSGAQVVLGDIGAVGMEDITIARSLMSVFLFHLRVSLPADEQLVTMELTRPSACAKEVGW
jgi:hypothetical protein